MTRQLDTLIIGAGLSGLTIAHKLQRNCPGHRFLLLDADSCTGGAIRSHAENGFRAEVGPHGFLDNCEESKLLLRETGLDKETVAAPLIDFVRYVYLHGKLNLIPQTPWKIINAPLIPWSAKLRVIADLWKEPLTGEPTVAKWIDHRFGKALLPYVDAVFTGTYAGDFNKLKIDAVMPGVRKLEQNHGSVLRGLVHMLREKKKTRGKSAKPTMPAMTSFADGMSRLPERLTEQLTPGDNLLLDTRVTSIGETADGWRVDSDKEQFTATNLVVAAPVNNSLALLHHIDQSMPLQKIAQTKIASVVCGFGGGATLPPGFGFLTPEQEQRFTLGCLFSSNMFPGRAPDGHILFEILIGGRRHPERLDLDDETLTNRALADVQDILDLPRSPVYTRVLRHEGGIPQLEKGYPDLLNWRDNLVARRPGLHVCGFGWEGIGLNDMMKTATRVASAIAAGRGDGRGEAAVKGVYF